MPSTEYTFVATFNRKLNDPDIFDFVGAPVAGADSFFAELGKIARQLQDKTLMAADAAAVRAKLQTFADGINKLNERITKSGVGPGSAQDAKFAKYFKSSQNAINLSMQRVAHAADEIAACNSASIQKFSSSVSAFLKKIGAVLGMIQIGKEFYDNRFTDVGIDKAEEKSLGVNLEILSLLASAAISGRGNAPGQIRAPAASNNKASLTSGNANFVSTQADAFVEQYRLVDQLPRQPDRFVEKVLSAKA